MLRTHLPHTMETMLPFHNPLGRPLKFTPQELAEKFAEYVQWCADNPFKSGTRTDYANGFAATEENRVRRISISGFQLFIGSSDGWWADLDKRKDGADFMRVKEQIKKYCETSQADMAAAGLLKENIISRLLGLADKKAVATEGVTIVVESQEQKDKMENIGNLGI